MKAKNIKNKIKEYFLKNPTVKLRVRQIERAIKVPLPSVIRYTKELVNEEILKIQEVSDVRFFTASRTSKEYLIEKRLFNIKQLYDSGLIDYLVNFYSNPLIIVFGSFSKGEDVESSDIDIYIETPSKKKVNLEEFEERLNKKIQLFVYSNIKKIPNPMLANNLLNGINLNGSVEVFK